MQNNHHFPQTENSLNNWDAPVRHAPGRYRDYREKYALTTGEVTARYCENITNPTVQPDGKTEMHTPIPDVAHVEQSKAYQEENPVVTPSPDGSTLPSIFYTFSSNFVNL